MALSKIQAESVNLADDYAFTGTVTGAGEITASTTAPAEGGTATTNVVQGLIKAWINFDGSATGAVGDYDRDSFNCSVITDHSTGEYSLGFTNNFNNANYAGVGISGSDGTTYTQARSLFINVTSPTTSAFRINTKQCDGGADRDDPQIHVMLLGDLA